MRSAEGGLAPSMLLTLWQVLLPGGWAYTEPRRTFMDALLDFEAALSENVRGAYIQGDTIPTRFFH